ncbi:MAG TPA: hypothetical protein VMU25_04065 [Candidatus Paceibacterota bacterium]|nr:hypothetical protein [Candidatus Paceibacterota bacterium]
MKKIFTSVLGALLCVPVLAFAQTASTSQSSLNQLMVVATALEAQASSLQSGQPLACAVLFSMPVVHLHETVVLAWGSVGAIDPEVSSTSQSMWAPHGLSTLSFDKLGTWKYSFTFYSQSGASTTCDALIKVVK